MSNAINSAGLDIIRKYEGLRLAAYVCPAGYITVGYGHRTDTLSVGEHVTKAQADAYLASDARKAFQVVVRETVGVALTCNQLSAVASLVFNIGERQFMASTIRRMLRDGNVSAAAGQFGRWIYATVNGKHVILKGLVKRRAAERGLFEK